MKSRCRALASQTRRLARLDFEERFALFEPHADLAPVRGSSLRQRVFTHWRTFWLFLFQTLSPGQSCRETVQAAKAFSSSIFTPARFAARATARNMAPVSIWI